MRVTSQSSLDGVLEQLFTLDVDGHDVPGVLWTPDGDAGPHPLVVVGHGGGQHKLAPGIVGRARRFVVEGGFAVAAVDAPAHGDRPRSLEHDRLIGAFRSRMQVGGDAAPVLAEFHELLTAQTVPGWRALVDAVQ